VVDDFEARGRLNLARRCSTWAWSSSTVGGVAPSCSTATEHTVSPQRVSGRPTTATSRKAGWSSGGRALGDMVEDALPHRRDGIEMGRLPGLDGVADQCGVGL
jgi:hypothetical protein